MAVRAEALAADWAARVRANREQVERVREGAEADDFYAPVSAMFVDDPHRVGDETLEALRELTQPSDDWLDIGAGAGRFALPLAMVVREVIAVEPSPAMVEALRHGMAGHRIPNVRVIQDRWPMARDRAPQADVALIAHVGYDIEKITPFLDAMEAAADRLCAAVLMERSPSSLADPFWPPVHEQQRAALPALPELVDLLRARGASPQVRPARRNPRTFADPEQLIGYLRQQLWVRPGSAADDRLRAALRGRVVEAEDGRLRLERGPTQVGIVTWSPRNGSPRHGYHASRDR